MKMMVVFVSSTFQDMGKEREKLLGGAFKQLESEAALKGIRFASIDLRWGITSASSDIETIRRCLDLVGECKPYFLALLGERYGWVPPKTHLQSLTPPFQELPPDGTSVTQLEILRFFERFGTEPESPKGLFFFLKNPRYKTQSDQECLAELHSKIKAEASAGRAEVHQYDNDESGLASMDELALKFFKARIDEFADEDLKSEFPLSSLAPIPDDIIRGWPEHAAAMRALGQGRIVAVDSKHGTLRTAFVDRIARDYLQTAGAETKTTFLHLGAEGVLSGDALKQALEESLKPSADTQAGEFIALDALESLADWGRTGAVDTLAASGVMDRIWKYADAGACFILGGDWSARASWLEDFPNLEVVRLDRRLLQSSEEVITYFKRNFAKSLTGPQADAICASSGNKEFNDFEQILLFDRIRRYGDLKPQGVTQDEFLLERIRHSIPDGENDLISDALSELASVAGKNRMPAIAHAISVICNSRHGVSLFDLKDMDDGRMAISSEEWALMRGHLGPLLTGTIGRIRCIDERARELVTHWLDDDALVNGRRWLRNAIFNRSLAAGSLSDLLDPERVMSLELRWLMSDVTEDDRATFLWEVLNPALWLSLAYHDWLLADREIAELFKTSITPNPDVNADNNPWLEIDRLGYLVAAEKESPSIPKSRLIYALDKAELVTNTPEQYSEGVLRNRVLACGIAQRRGIVISSLEVSKTTLGWSLDWARALSQAQPQYPVSVVERAWVEFALLFVWWMRQSARKSGVINMGWPADIAHRVRVGTPREIDTVLTEIANIPLRDLRHTPVERAEAWQSRLREWLRIKQDIPSNQSQLMELFLKEEQLRKL